MAARVLIPSVEVTGIPVHPVFARAADLEALRRKHQVAPERPLVLVLCGGFGVGPVGPQAAADVAGALLRLA